MGQHIGNFPIRKEGFLPISLPEHEALYFLPTQSIGLSIKSLESTVLPTTPSSLKHAINNPLAIISGNAQLLQDLIRKKEYRGAMVKPLEDIEEACHRIAALLDKLEASVRPPR